MALLINQNSFNVNSGQGSIDPIYQRIMFEVYLNRSISNRIEVIQKMGYNIILFYRSGIGAELTRNEIKIAYDSIGKLGSLNFNWASHSQSQGHTRPTTEKSYYIQITGSESLRKDRYYERLVAFVEITETELLRRTRKAKLLKLSR